VREQEVQLHYYTVASPTDGIVGDIPVRVGDRVTVSTLLTTVDQPGALEAYVYVPVERAAEVKVGTPVEILDEGSKPLATSRIRFISPQVDNQTQTVLVKAAIESTSRLRTGEFIRARVVWGTHDSPTIPVLAVTRISGQYFGYVAEEKDGSLVARQRPLSVGQIVGNDYVVRDGIKPGDRIIVSGTQFLADGVPVSPQG
jgi:RND family efflux transporter MFP subunit